MENNTFCLNKNRKNEYMEINITDACRKIIKNRKLIANLFNT